MIIQQFHVREILMNILITGGSGFLGKRTASQFTALGHDVMTPSHSALDITDTAALDTWFSRNHPQAVIHCAAISDTGLCQQEPERTFRINVEGSVNLAAACSRYGAKMILCSSDQVYFGSILPGPHRETEAVTPGNEYGKQKLLAEQRCQAVCPDTVCLRLSWMYALDSFPGEHGHLLKNLRCALEDENLSLSWPLYDHRGITDVDEAVRNLPSVLDFPAGVYNFGAGNDMDTYHTIHAVLKSFGLASALARLEPNLQAFADAPRDIRMNSEKLNSMGISFEDTCSGLCCALSKFLLKN